MTTRRKLSGQVLALFMVFSTSSYADYADHGESSTDSGVVSTIQDNPKTSGCVAGAMVGFVVPGLGNIVGCAVGVAVGWWSHSSSDEQVDEG